METEEKLSNWLKGVVDKPFELTPIPGDASFRQYYRIKEPSKTYIAVYAEPEKESHHDFVVLAKALKTLSLNVPEIYAEDLRSGFLLISDLGDTLYLDVLSQTNAEQLYHDALNALTTMQVNAQHITRPAFSESLLYTELNLFTEWFLKGYLQQTLSSSQQGALEALYQVLIDNALTQPQVFVHRDYHSRNLMVCLEGNPGIIDFQDAVIGPLTYDYVSLLKDCYIKWPQTTRESWLLAIHRELIIREICDVNFDKFMCWFDLMGVQRHLKAIGIFSRLFLRDQKAQYLQHIPRTWSYISDLFEIYPELAPLQRLDVESAIANIKKQLS